MLHNKKEATLTCFLRQIKEHCSALSAIPLKEVTCSRTISILCVYYLVKPCFFRSIKISVSVSRIVSRCITRNLSRDRCDRSKSSYPHIVSCNCISCFQIKSLYSILPKKLVKSAERSFSVFRHEFFCACSTAYPVKRPCLRRALIL